MNCNSYVKGIEKNDIKCAGANLITGGLQSYVCPWGWFIYGLDANNVALCTLPPSP